MKYPRSILDREEVERMLAACPERYSGARTRAAIALLFRTGMRPGELLALCLGDIRPRHGRLIARIERPKGHARAKFPAPPREVLVDDRTAGYYRGWLRYRGSHYGVLFCNRWGEKMTLQCFGRQLKEVARAAGIRKRVNPHCFRHSFAHDFAYEVGDVGALMGALGHRSIRTTQIYLQEIGCAPHVLRAMEARNW